MNRPPSRERESAVRNYEDAERVASSEAWKIIKEKMIKERDMAIKCLKTPGCDNREADQHRGAIDILEKLIDWPERSVEANRKVIDQAGTGKPRSNV